VENGDSRLVLEDDVLELDRPLDRRQARLVLVAGVFGELVADLPDPLEAREGFRDLAADRDDLDDGTHEHGEQRRELEERARRHAAGEDVVRADPEDRDGDRAEEKCRERRDGGEAGHRSGDVAKQPVDTLGEHERFAALGPVGLDDPHSSEGLGQAARNLRVDLGALAEEGPEGLEGVEQHQAEEREDRQRDRRQLHVQGNQVDKGDRGGQHASDDLHEPRPDQVADPFGVGHDAGKKRSDLGLIEEGDGKPADVPLHAPPHLRDGTLGGLAQDLRQGVRRHGLEHGRARRGEDEGREKLALPFSEHFVQEVPRHERDDEPREAIDEQDAEAQGQPAPASRDQLESVLEDRRERGFLFLFLARIPSPASLAAGDP